MELNIQEFNKYERKYNVFYGAILYFYYITLGYIFNYKKFKMTLDLTNHLLK